MAARLDHITVVAPSLEVGSTYVEAALGVSPGAGRTHPGMATHNLLLALGSDVYLEVISIDPSASPIDRPRWFGLNQVRAGSKARLAAWVASTDDIDNAAVPDLGDVETMRREAHLADDRESRRPRAARRRGPAADPALIERASGRRAAAERSATSRTSDPASGAVAGPRSARPDRPGCAACRHGDPRPRVQPRCRDPHALRSQRARRGLTEVRATTPGNSNRTAPRTRTGRSATRRP